MARPTPPAVHSSASAAPRPSRSRWTRRHGGALGALLALAVALSAATGCMVMDELDSAAAKMPTSDKKKDAKPGPAGKAPTPAERLAAAKSAVNERSKQWWQQAKTMTPGEKPAGIVSCRVGGEVRFMAKEDCIVQGGRPADGSS